MDKLLKLKPVPKVWAPVVVGLAGIVVKALISGEIDQTEVTAVVVLAVYALIGWTVPNGPVIETHDSDLTFETERTNRLRLRKLWSHQDQSAELSE